MADSPMLERLKATRTTAKRQFSRLANDVSKMHDIMSENELRDFFRKLTTEVNKVLEANDDIEAQYIEENGSLNQEQKADIEKTASECQEKLDELKDIILKTLWANYGDEEVNLAVEAAETAAERVASIAPSENKEAFEFMLEHFEKLFRNAKDLNTKWKCWAPAEEQKSLQSRVRELERALPTLTARKAEFIQYTKSSATTPPLQPTPASLPTFPGTSRAFPRWRRDWEVLQKQGLQTDSQEITKFKLLNSIDKRTARELRLSTYPTADEIFKVLDKRFGNKTAIVIEIVKELQMLPPLKADDPKQIIELTELVEKALTDLGDIGETAAVKNPLLTKSIESKLPDVLKKEWLIYAAEKNEGNLQTTPSSDGAAKTDRFDTLLAFLRSQKAIYKQTRPSAQSSSIHPEVSCVVCGESKHQLKLYFCKKFRALKLAEKRDAAKKVGACEKCLEIHNDFNKCTDEFLCKNPECRENNKMHHFYLCPKAGKTGQKTQSTARVINRSSYNAAQKDFVRKLPPELAAECRHVFTSSVNPTQQWPPGRKLVVSTSHVNAAGSYNQRRAEDWQPHQNRQRHKPQQCSKDPQRMKTARS